MLPTLPECSEAFSLSASVYDSLYATKNYDAEVAHILPLLGSPTSGANYHRLLIDWGAGTGQFTKRFAAAGWRAIGFDYSWPMVKLAQAAGVDVRPGDMAEPVLQGTPKAHAQVCLFAAFSYAAAHHCPLAVLQNFLSAASRRGRLVFDFVNGEATILPEQKRSITDAAGRRITIRQQKTLSAPGVIENVITYTLRGPKATRSTRWQEQHFMRAFLPGEMLDLLRQSGWTNAEFHDFDKATAHGEPYYLTVSARADK